MKKIITILIALLFLAGCAGVGTQPNTTELEAKIQALEERLEDIEMMGAAGVGSNFYPARSLSGDAAGDLDDITSVSDAGSGDADTGFVTTDESEAVAAYDHSFFAYKLDDDSVICSAEDLPLCIDSGDGGAEYWTLLDVWGRTFKTPQSSVAGDYFRLLEASGNGTDYIQGKADDDVGTNSIFAFSSSVAATEDLTIAFTDADAIGNRITFNSTTGVTDFVLDDGATDSPGWTVRGGDNEEVKMWYDDSDDRVCFTHSGGTNNEEICFAMDDVANSIQVETGSAATQIDFGALNLNTTGNISGGVLIGDIDDPDNWTMTGDAMYGGIWIATTGLGTGGLPAVAAGMNFVVISEVAAVVTLDPNAADTIYLDGLAATQDEDIVSSGTVGDVVRCYYRSANAWACISDGFAESTP